MVNIHRSGQIARQAQGVCGQEESCTFGDQTATKYLEILAQNWLGKKAQDSLMVQKVLCTTSKRQLKHATKTLHEDNKFLFPVLKIS